MQFLNFVDYTSDIETFEEGNFSDDFVIWLLFNCKVVMSKMSYGLETVGEGYFRTGEEI